MSCRVINTRTGEVLLTRLKTAEQFHTRFFGLMGKKNLPDGEGLRIQPCSSIHCFFMRMAIDVVFLDNEGRVLHLIEGMKPWRVSPLVKGAKAVIEAAEGTFQHRVQLGDLLKITSE